MIDVLRNSLNYGDLPFRDFVEMALYHPQLGYYSRSESPVGKGGDFVTSPSLSPLFGFAVSRLIDAFLSRAGDSVSQIVDVGCGDGALLRSLGRPAWGIDRNLGRAVPDPNINYRESLAALPPAEARLLISNELFDALPFARLVQRGEHLHELWVTERDGALDWTEHEAEAAYEEYFASRGITLDDGQFADVSLEWEATYDEFCRAVPRGLIVTFDYGLPQSKLFRGRMRRFGTAAAYAKQRVSRDLLANPGEQDLTAHINFDDLIRTGERHGFATLFFDIQAKFLLALGAAEHELLAPLQTADGGQQTVADLPLAARRVPPADVLELLQQRDDAKRLILPDGIGHDIRVLVQGRGMGHERWEFERKLF